MTVHIYFIPPANNVFKTDTLFQKLGKRILKKHLIC